MGRIYREASRVVIWLGEDHAYPQLRRRLSHAEIEEDRSARLKDMQELKLISW